jgi:hypothetical protein
MSISNLNDVMETMKNFLIIIAGIIFVIYICIALLLNKLNKLIYGKGTWMAFIPIFNIYLLGKLTINKVVGFILVLCIFLSGYFSTTINGVEKVYAILPGDARIMVGSFSSIITFVLLIYAIVKRKRLKKEKRSNADALTINNNVTPQNDINQPNNVVSQSSVNQMNVIEDKRNDEVSATKGTYITLLIVFIIALAFIFFLPNIVRIFNKE